VTDKPLTVLVKEIKEAVAELDNALATPSRNLGNQTKEIAAYRRGARDAYKEVLAALGEDEP
jgi:hypothetical protein